MSDNNNDNSEIELTVDKLTDILKRAEEAHAEYEKEELNGEGDENWPEFYAEFVMRELQNLDQ